MTVSAGHVRDGDNFQNKIGPHGKYYAVNRETTINNSAVADDSSILARRDAAQASRMGLVARNELKKETKKNSGYNAKGEEVKLSSGIFSFQARV